MFLLIANLYDADLLARSTQRCPETDAYAVQAFIILLQLLEDEDRTVRIAAACLAGHAAAAFGSEDCSKAAVPYVQERVFAIAAKSFGHRPDFMEQLLAWILRWA